MPTRTEGETSDLKEPSDSLLTLAKDLERNQRSSKASNEMLKAAFSEHESLSERN
ncbi:MbeB family mobilization protein [Klebsiella pneumoniae]|uniref:MbeB family mobilization protein n=1 Tax=Klebsiella pneumoniae TaxID=573 RepID=UPI0022B6DB74|nr:MbeB family mobilization protein [Klebsiella pneumoniae]